MISKGEIVDLPTAAASASVSAFETAAAPGGFTLLDIDQVMTVSEIKPTAASDAMILTTRYVIMSSCSERCERRRSRR
jgi:hypothetical protein